ncbi:CHAT domain-containing protein [Parachryseolinea silvisoli]|uniref:CHAT domain-containing protein n=1 Tax=Parachryseolinea silvisoli TaxID=2873601 RepID=UPI002265E783|nr:CHAT domain-containing tetratricopeptide repeat protein [Parachryseolinea silvisoli]MCD9015348.1 CHAT domain-containing protein [Parachryseolinea silvisoli]
MKIYAVAVRILVISALFENVTAALAQAQPDIINKNKTYTFSQFDSVYNAGGYDKAKTIAEHLVARAHERPSDTLYTQALRLLALSNRALGHLQAAEEIFEQIATTTEPRKQQTAFYRNILLEWGNISREIGNYAKAENILQGAIALHREQLSAMDSLEYANCMDALGSVYMKGGEYEKAERSIQAALQISERYRDTNTSLYLIHLTDLAASYNAAGKHTEAEPVYLKILALKKEVFGENHASYGLALSNTATFYANTGRYAQAEKMLLRALEIRAEKLGRRHPDYIISLANLAVLYDMMKKPQEAYELYGGLIELTREQFGENTPDYVYTLRDAANNYQSLEKYSEAEALYLQAVEGMKRVLGESHPQYALTLNSLGYNYFLQGQYAEADPLFEQAQKIYREKVSELHPYIAITHDNQGRLRAAQGATEDARNHFRLAREIRYKRIREMFPIMSEKEKNSMYASLRRNFDLSRNFAVQYGDYADALEIQLFTKSLLLFDLHRIQRQVQRDPAFSGFYHRWQDARKAIANAYNQSPEQRLKSGVVLATLESKADSLEKYIALRSGAFTRVTRSLKTDWRQIGQALRPGEAAVEIIRFLKYDFTANRDFSDTVAYAILIILPGANDPALVLLENGNDMEAKYLPAYHDDIRNQTYEADPYTWFWKPVADKLAGVKTVYVSADGIYHLVSLEALLNRQTGMYAGQEKSIRMVPSLRSLLPAPVEVNSQEYVLFGYPTFDKKSEQQNRVAAVTDAALPRELVADTGERDYNCSPLPATKAEVESIARLLKKKRKKSTVFMETAASEEALKTISSPQVLHIATHGYFEKNPDNNPMLRAGLLFAGARQTLEKKGSLPLSGDDGVVTAYEAVGLDLTGTELVVLSACETGLGEIRSGEGVYGLQRALTIAGADAVLMSLWKVNDQVTGELMTYFYEYWLKGLEKHHALQKAQQRIRSRYPHPALWGGFVMIGK